MDQILDSWFDYLQANDENAQSFSDAFAKLAASVLWIPLGYFGIWQLLMQMTFSEIEYVLNVLNMFALAVLGPGVMRTARGLIPKSLFARNSMSPITLIILHNFTKYDFEQKVCLVMRGIVALFCCIYRFVNRNRARRSRTQESNGTTQNREVSG